MPTTAQLRSRLVSKLKELFQLDQPDLDFGFYRIMHAKAQQVTEFLEKDLLKVIEDTFGNQADNQSASTLANARRELEEALGADALDENGKLKEAFANLPAGKRYTEAVAKAEAAKDAMSAEGEIYDHLYRKREYLEPRLEIRDLEATDDNLPQDEFYQLIVDGDASTVIEAIERVKRDIEEHKDELLTAGDLSACNFGRHLFQPLFHVRKSGKITILPVALNESEYQFVEDLMKWCQAHAEDLETEDTEIFLLRNQSRGKGVGFFEAGGFHPDFILWVLKPGHQYVNFVEPHGMLREGPGSEKVQFHKRIKALESRLNCQDVTLNSFILSWTRYPELQWGPSQAELEKQHVLFMTDDRERYIGKLMAAVLADEE